MIYAKNITAEQVLYIPKNGMGDGAQGVAVEESYNDDFSADFTTTNGAILCLRSTVRLAMTSRVATSIEETRSYYKVRVNFPENIGVGEYEYELRQQGVLKATGLLEVQRVINNTIYQYGKTTTYKEYYGG